MSSAAVDVDIVVVGAGVVGLAAARALALAGRETWVLEANERIAEGISSRNSGVIHAGLYYPTGSLKAQWCLRGRDLLYAYCAQRNVAHRRTGKLVVAAAEAEVAALEALYKRGQANGLAGLRWLTGPEALALEPALRCAAAIDSPDSGIVDPAELALALVGDIENAGSRVLCRNTIARVRVSDGAFELVTDTGDSLRCRHLVNAAGLGAIDLAASIDTLDRQHIPTLRYGAGHYYTIYGRVPFQRLIYPMPEAHAHGVHLGFDLGGRCRFGPDLRWIAAPDYRFDDSHRDEFAAAIRHWWPGLDESELLPDFVGVRPKISGPNEPGADFRIDDARVHGIAGLINLFGIESPGLTSCLAIGEAVEQRIAAQAR